jgi:hypothetical protein
MSGGYPAKRAREQRRFDLIDARRHLAEAQTALELASHHDPEAIAEARRAFADARQRIRDLTSKGPA